MREEPEIGEYQVGEDGQPMRPGLHTTEGQSDGSEYDTSFDQSLKRRVVQPRTVLSFAIAIAIAVFFLRRLDLDINAVWSNVRSANYWLLLLAAGAYFSAFFLRAIRWRWMLARVGVGKDPGEVLPSTAALAQILMVSWFINCIVPAKLGDAYRAFRVRVDYGIRYTVSLGTILSERLIDLVILVLMMTVTGAFAFSGNLPREAMRALVGGGILLGIALVVLTVLWMARQRVEAWVPQRFQGQYRNLSGTLFTSLRAPWFPAAVSVCIWILEGARVFLVAEAVGVRLSLPMAGFVALMSALLTTLPVTPAGLGVVEVAIVAVLKLVDLQTDLAGSIAFLDRLITYWLLILVGLIVYLWSLRVRRSEGAANVKPRVGSPQSESSST